jgi:hypothetical protein
MSSFRYRAATAVRGALLALLAILATACATTGATFRSGVGDKYVEHAPYYAGSAAGLETARIAHLPVSYQAGATQPASFDPKSGASSPVAALLAELNASLDRLGASRRLTSVAPKGTAPDVIFGCATDVIGDCLTGNETAGPALKSTSTDQPLMRLAVGRPSRDWIAAVRTALDSAGADHALVLSLEIGEYRVTKTGWRNDKSIELGTGYTMKLPWLTSLDAPVSVLQLTGAVVDRQGRAVRIGAEGLLARRTNLALSGMGVQRLISDEDVAQLRTARRADLPGGPLVTDVALKTLVDQLTTGHARVVSP